MELYNLPFAKDEASHVSHEEALLHMPNLDTLTISGNMLSRCLNVIQLKKLKLINFAGNEIETVNPDHFLGLTDLQTVILNDNPLKSLPNLCRADVNVLFGGATDLICDCSVKYLKYLFPDSEYAPCSQPGNLVERKISEINADEFVCDTGRFMCSILIFVCSSLIHYIQ